MLNFLNLIKRREKTKKNGIIFTENKTIKIISDDTTEFNYNGLWLDIDKVKAYTQHLDYVILSHWKCCFLSCVYCREKKTDNLTKIKYFDIFPIIGQLIDENLITTETKIIFECGDATLHAEFDKLMFFLMNYGMKDIEINISAMRFCESIEKGMKKNIAKVIITIDSFNPNIYEKIKGLNRVDIAVSNIKKYIEAQNKSAKQVILKYTLVQNANDNKEEILNWFNYAKDLGIKKIAIDIDEKWYNSINDEFSKHITELVVYTKNLSDSNKIDIKLTDRIKAIYCE